VKVNEIEIQSSVELLSKPPEVREWACLGPRTRSASLFANTGQFAMGKRCERLATVVHRSDCQRLGARSDRHRGAYLCLRAIKTNIADSLNIIVQIDRRPGIRCVSEVLEIRGYDPEADRYDLYPVYSCHPESSFGRGSFKQLPSKEFE
jgi:hypothetical protein